MELNVQTEALRNVVNVLQQLAGDERTHAGIASPERWTVRRENRAARIF